MSIMDNSPDRSSTKERNALTALQWPRQSDDYGGRTRTTTSTPIQWFRLDDGVMDGQSESQPETVVDVEPAQEGTTTTTTNTNEAATASNDVKIRHFKGTPSHTERTHGHHHSLQHYNHSWWYLQVIIFLSIFGWGGQGRQLGGLSTNPPEVPSTHLYLHRRLYRGQPPHDRTLYETLQVSPTATAAQIDNAYQNLCHKYQSTETMAADKEEEGTNPTAFLLDEIHAAYDILKNDDTRWPYHLYGLRGHEIHTLPLVRLFLGQECIFSSVGDRTTNRMDPALKELLQWMGYDYDSTDAALAGATGTTTATSSTSHNNTKPFRIHRLATDLVEGWLRPFVEGRLTKAALVQRVSRMSDRRKTTLPMGAQVLRCLGRAYQHAGKAYLRQDRLDHGGVLWNTARERFRQGQYWWGAAGWRSRALLAQHVAARQSRKTSHTRKVASITYHNEDSSSEEEEWEYSILEKPDSDNDVLGEGNQEDTATSNGEDDTSTLALTNKEMRFLEQWNAQNTLRQVTLLEALWKTYKIDLYSSARQACESIFSGEYFFYPLSIGDGSTTATRQVDGWVGSKGQTIDTEKGLKRVAEGLILMGTVMVDRSKQGTAWRKR